MAREPSREGRGQKRGKGGVGADLKLSSGGNQGLNTLDNQEIGRQKGGMGLGAVGVGHCGRSFRALLPGGVPDTAWKMVPWWSPVGWPTGGRMCLGRYEKPLFGWV